MPSKESLKNKPPVTTNADLAGSLVSEEPKMKKFSKIDVIESMGLTRKKFNRSTQQFETSYLLQIRSYLIHIAVITTFSKYILSLAFDQNSTAQLFVGSFWTYLNYNSRFYLAVLVSGSPIVFHNQLSKFTLYLND